MVSFVLIIAALILLLVPLLGPRTCPEQVWTRCKWGAFISILLGLLCLESSFMLRKLIGQALMPMGLLWLGLLWLTVMLLRHGPRQPALLSLGLWLAFSMLGNPWVVTHLNAWFGVPMTRASMDRPLDAVLLLGGSTYTDDMGTARLNGAGDRLLTVARVYARGQTSRIVTYAPPWKEPIDRKHHNGTETVEILTAMGIPQGVIIWDWGPVNTRAEVLQFARLAEQEGWHNLGVVSTGNHLHRALYYGRDANLELVPISASRPSGETSSLNALAVLPQAWAFSLVTLIAWESVGLFAAQSANL